MAVNVGSIVLPGVGSKPKVAVETGFLVEDAAGTGVSVARIAAAFTSVCVSVTSATDVDVGWLPPVETGFALGISNPTSAASRIATTRRLKSHLLNLSGRNPKKKRVRTPKSKAHATCAEKTKMPCGKISPTPLARPKGELANLRWWR